MYHPKYSLFYDFHTESCFRDLGREIDADAFAEECASCGVDFLTFHARCNRGFCYYDTQTGIRHPGLKTDLFGDISTACRKRGIRVSAYLNGGISNEEGILHRDWLRLSFDGRQYPAEKETPYLRTMCFNSPYREHLLEMIREIAGKYHPDGFFLDCFSPQICVCPLCSQKMLRENLNPLNLEDVRRFGRESTLDFAREIASAVRQYVREPLLYFNGLGYEEQQGIATYLECECLPTAPAWGYDFLPLAARYIRTLHFETAQNMTARFYDWGDFGSIRKSAGIRNDLFLGLALGLRPDLSSHLHPEGKWENRVFQCIRETYREVQKYGEYFDNCSALVEAAVLFQKDAGHFASRKYLKGAVRVLDELRIQFDVITPASDFSRYRLLILPEGVAFDEETAAKIRHFQNMGNAVFACASSGLKPDRSDFALQEEWGMAFKGECRYNPAYFLTTHDFSEDLSAMPRSLPCNGNSISLRSAMEIGAVMVKPLQNRGWDGLNASCYNPPQEITGEPFLVLRDGFAYCTHDIFTGYYAKGVCELKEFIASVLERLLPERLVKADGFPDYAKAILVEQPERNRLILHLLAGFHEEELPVAGAAVKVRTNRKIKRAVMHGKEIPFRREGNYVALELPFWRGYAPLTLEAK